MDKTRRCLSAVWLRQSLRELTARHKVLLTGTPLQNNIAELFMLMHFLDRGKFGSLEEFEAEFASISHGEQVSCFSTLIIACVLCILRARSQMSSSLCLQPS